MTTTTGTPAIFSCERDVLFQDIDAAGIVFFARLFDYCHDAFLVFFKARGFSLAKILAEKSWGLPLAHAEADYAMPLRFGDRVRVEITAVDFGEKSMRVASRIVDSSEKQACSVVLVHVFVELGSVRSRKVPDDVRDALKDCATPSAPA